MMESEKFRVIARAIVLAPDRRVVMVTSHDRDALVVPGGAVDAGETLQAAAVRETKEECQIDVSIGEVIWLREYTSRKRDQRNLEVYFLARPEPGIALLDRWTLVDAADPRVQREAGLYTREALQSMQLPVYPKELRDEFWDGLNRGFHRVYLG